MLHLYDADCETLIRQSLPVYNFLHFVTQIVCIRLLLYKYQSSESPVRFFYIKKVVKWCTRIIFYNMIKASPLSGTADH